MYIVYVYLICVCVYTLVCGICAPFVHIVCHLMHLYQFVPDVARHLCIAWHLIYLFSYLQVQRAVCCICAPFVRIACHLIHLFTNLRLM